MPYYTVVEQGAPIKVNKWNIQEVRVAFDDSVVQYMNEELKFKEDHSLILLKLAVYFLINLVGVSTALYGYLVKPFAQTRLLVGVGSAIYLIATGIWTLLLQYRIPQTVYRGKDAQGKAVWLRSSLSYPQAIYRLEMLQVGSNKKTIGSAFEVSVGQWIDVDGFLCSDSITKQLHSQLAPKFKRD